MKNQTAISDTITADTFLPDIVARYPATRAVLDRYGLHGCGGPQGPREQLGCFARLHGVPIENLLRELNEAAIQPAVEPAEFAPSLADTIYRPFFLAGIATVLTLGCGWGAINLLTIGLKQNELSAVLGIRGEPPKLVVHRWPRALPQYSVELPNVWQEARETWCATPGHLLFGNYTGQISLRGMIESAGGLV